MKHWARLLLSSAIAFGGCAALFQVASADPPADPTITAVSRNLTSDYGWNFDSGFKQQHGSYVNGRSLHAVLRRTGTTGEKGYPDYLVWFDEHTGQKVVLSRAVAYPTLGPNPTTHAVFDSEAPPGGSGRYWWVIGGRADSQP